MKITSWNVPELEETGFFFETILYRDCGTHLSHSGHGWRPLHSAAAHGHVSGGRDRDVACGQRFLRPGLPRVAAEADPRPGGAAFLCSMGRTHGVGKPPPWRGGPFWVDILYPLHVVDGGGFSRPWGLSSSSPAFRLPVPTQPLFTLQVIHHSAVPVVCLVAAVDTICHPAVCLETCEVEWMELATAEPQPPS